MPNQPIDPEREQRLRILEDLKSVEIRAFRRTVQKNIHATKLALAKVQAELVDINR